MASLSFDQTKNGYRLSFRKDNRKCSLWLGSISPAKAEDWKQHLEHLLDVADKEPPSKPTWLLISARTSRFAKLGQKMQSDGGYGWLHVEIAATRTGKVWRMKPCAGEPERQSSSLLRRSSVASWTRIRSVSCPARQEAMRSGKLSFQGLGLRSALRKHRTSNGAQSWRLLDSVDSEFASKPGNRVDGKVSSQGRRELVRQFGAGGDEALRNGDCRKFPPSID